MSNTLKVLIIDEHTFSKLPLHRQSKDQQTLSKHSQDKLGNSNTAHSTDLCSRRSLKSHTGKVCFCDANLRNIFNVKNHRIIYTAKLTFGCNVLQTLTSSRSNLYEVTQGFNINVLCKFGRYAIKDFICKVE